MLADYLQRPMGWGWVRLKLADYHYDRSAAGLRETHTHAHFLTPLILILSNGHYWIRTSDLHDVNVTL